MDVMDVMDEYYDKLIILEDFIIETRIYPSCTVLVWASGKTEVI